MDIPKIFKSNVEIRFERKNLTKLLIELDLIYGEFEILYLLFLSNQKPLQPSVIGSRLNCEPAAISRLVKLLSQKNLTTYEHDKNDRRQIFVRLTESGKTAIDSVLTQSCH